MKKSLTIAIKDLLIIFRDPAALIFMLLAPLALTLVISLAFGNDSSSSGPQDIPVALVNHDTGQYSSYFIEAFQSDDLADLVNPISVNTDEEARKMVDDDKAAAAVIVPENFSESIMPSALVNARPEDVKPEMINQQTAVVEVYVNVSRSVSAGIIRSIVDTIVGRFNARRMDGMVVMNQLITSGRVALDDAQSVGMIYGESLGGLEEQNSLIGLEELTYTPEGGALKNFDWKQYSAASMALFFLMFTMMSSGRSILVERDRGTLSRMLVSPTTRSAVLGGKMLGGFLTGLAQMAILIVSGKFLFNVQWGDPLAVTLLTLAVVAAVTGWGLIPAAFSRTPGQASAIGSALTLTFAALAGNFVPRMAMPIWLQKISYVTPNGWGLEAYHYLIQGGTLADVAVPIMALLGMAVITFGVSIYLFRRQYA